MEKRMSYDDVAWEKSEEIEDAWKKEMLKQESLMEVGNFIVKHRSGIPDLLHRPETGAFNVVARMDFEDGSAIIRFPIPGSCMFPEEKTRYEVAAIRFIQEQTAIPVPFILHWGLTKESPCNFGPFIFMDYNQHSEDACDALNTPGLTHGDRPILDPNIEHTKLEKLYGQMAGILLQLSTVSLPRIGSLTEVEDGVWEVTNRPITFNMNNLVQFGTFPRSKLPSSTFETSSSYFLALAEMNLHHLSHQRNDAIESADDCRRKYIARHLFRQLARKSLLTKKSTDSGPFKPWCDDLRPSNILVNSELEVVAVIDWEFTYAAPVDFIHAPPWWLLLSKPESWEGGLNSWIKEYEPRLQVFLKVLREREDASIESGILKEEQRLSEHMQRSWDTGDFWLMYAARNSFVFDLIFWKFLDERFFGPGGGWDGWNNRLHLLDKEEIAGMEPFVEKKLKEAKARTLQGWEPYEEVTPEDRLKNTAFNCMGLDTDNNL